MYPYHLLKAYCLYTVVLKAMFFLLLLAPPHPHHGGNLDRLRNDVAATRGAHRTAAELIMVDEEMADIAHM